MTLIYIAFGISVLLSLWHLAEEYCGELWDYFGNIAGVCIPRWLGVFAFTGLLGIALFVAGLGILDLDENPTARWPSLVGIGFLIGTRLSDWWNSHFRLQRKFPTREGYPSNPGLLSAWFYLGDAALLIVLLGIYREQWIAQPSWPPLLIGLLLGTIFFFVLIPALKLIRHRLPKAYRTSAWG